MSDSPKNDAGGDRSRSAGAAPGGPGLSSRARRRWLLLGFGLLVTLVAAIWSKWSEQTSAEARGWDAYHHGEYERALELFSAAIEKRPAGVDAWIGRAWAHTGRKEWKQAIADADEALQREPDSAMAYTARGLAEEGLGELPKAMDDFTAAIHADPKRATPYYYRARVAYAHGLKGTDPLADLAEAERLDPRYAPAFALEGLLRLERKQYDEAIAACDRALAVDPAEATASLYRGYARLAKGDADGAADLERAYRLDPSLRGASAPGGPLPR